MAEQIRSFAADIALLQIRQTVPLGNTLKNACIFIFLATHVLRALIFFLRYRHRHRKMELDT